MPPFDWRSDSACLEDGWARSDLPGVGLEGEPSLSSVDVCAVTCVAMFAFPLSRPLSIPDLDVFRFSSLTRVFVLRSCSVSPRCVFHSAVVHGPVPTLLARCALGCYARVSLRRSRCPLARLISTRLRCSFRGRLLRCSLLQVRSLAAQRGFHSDCGFVPRWLSVFCLAPSTNFRVFARRASFASYHVRARRA